MDDKLMLWAHWNALESIYIVWCHCKKMEDLKIKARCAYENIKGIVNADIVYSFTSFTLFDFKFLCISSVQC